MKIARFFIVLSLLTPFINHTLIDDTKTRKAELENFVRLLTGKGKRFPDIRSAQQAAQANFNHNNPGVRKAALNIFVKLVLRGVTTSFGPAQQAAQANLHDDDPAVREVALKILKMLK